MLEAMAIPDHWWNAFKHEAIQLLQQFKYYQPGQMPPPLMVPTPQQQAPPQQQATPQQQAPPQQQPPPQQQAVGYGKLQQLETLDYQSQQLQPTIPWVTGSTSSPPLNRFLVVHSFGSQIPTPVSVMDLLDFNCKYGC